jgi:hypothetical protein
MTELTGLRRLNTAMDFTYLISIIMLILSFGYVIFTLFLRKKKMPTKKGHKMEPTFISLIATLPFSYLPTLPTYLSFSYVIYAHMNDQSVLDPCIDFRAQLSTYYQYLQTKEALLVNEIKLLTGNSS